MNELGLDKNVLELFGSLDGTYVEPTSNQIDLRNSEYPEFSRKIVCVLHSRSLLVKIAFPIQIAPHHQYGGVGDSKRRKKLRTLQGHP